MLLLALLTSAPPESDTTDRSSACDCSGIYTVWSLYSHFKALLLSVSDMCGHSAHSGLLLQTAHRNQEDLTNKKGQRAKENQCDFSWQFSSLLTDLRFRNVQRPVQ
ncbi:hypothetical protein WMY93_023320 [Mugilogobius chulae]|uniref:Secreted protein n=1 Tax=Mugilogobius chulae TaxID=88201 RepID=A0AAW0N8E4_9GOBI